MFCLLHAAEVKPQFGKILRKMVCNILFT